MTLVPCEACDLFLVDADDPPPCGPLCTHCRTRAYVLNTVGMFSVEEQREVDEIANRYYTEAARHYLVHGERPQDLMNPRASSESL